MQSGNVLNHVIIKGKNRSQPFAQKQLIRFGYSLFAPNLPVYAFYINDLFQFINFKDTSFTPYYNNQFLF